MGVAKAPKFATANQFRRLCQPLLTTTATRQTLVNAGDRLFKRPFFLPHGTQNTAEQGRHTAPDALESAFGCRLRSAGELLGVDGPAKMRRPVAPSTGYPLPSGRFRRSPNHSDAADRSGPGRRVA